MHKSKYPINNHYIKKIPLFRPKLFFPGITLKKVTMLSVQNTDTVPRYKRLQMEPLTRKHLFTVI
uniref:Uncharacterized protein n=1 Tax=Manihot esculenta TaxID=3983 RepID=A0A2C9UPC5_MANES